MKKYCLFFFLLLLLSCSEDSGKKSDVSVIFTCDTQGRIEPCGCFTGQYGGLSRISTFIKDFKSDIVVRVDAGDSAPGNQDFDLIQYKYVLEAFSKMKFDALNCGVREASIDYDNLKNFAKREKQTPLISANLLRNNDELVFKPYIKFERDGKKIAVIGVLDENLPGEALGKGLKVENMENAITRHLADIKDSDFLILLAFTDEKRLKTLARKFFEFDLILGGKVRQPSQHILRENRSTILFTTNQAKNVGFVQGELKNKIFTAKEFDIPLLFEKIKEDPEILSFTKTYRKEVAQAKLKIDTPGEGDENLISNVKPLATYVGTETCSSCHPQSHKIWSQSSHAKAFETLNLKESQSDPKCIKCHTVGFGEESGYRRAFENTKLTNVGCENCHGPGSEHVRQRTSGLKNLFTYRPVGEGDCKSCHYGEFSRPFNWEHMWPLIKHGKEGQQ